MHDTGWPRPIGCLILIDHFPQKSPIISGSFAKRDLQLNVYIYVCFIYTYMYCVHISFACTYIKEKPSYGSLPCMYTYIYDEYTHTCTMYVYYVYTHTCTIHIYSVYTHTCTMYVHRYARSAISHVSLHHEYMYNLYTHTCIVYTCTMYVHLYQR